MRFVKLAVLLAMLAGLFVAVLPASAALGATILSITPNTDDCTLMVVFKVEDAGTYYVQIWDDFNNQASAEISVPAGGTGTAVFNIGDVLLGAPGIGVYVVDNPTTLTGYYDFRDPYVFDAGECGGPGAEWSLVSVSAAAPPVGACKNPLPTDYIVRSVPGGAPAYFEPRTDTYANFDLPAGTWYVGESDGDFSHVWISCQGNLIWIPTTNVAG